MGRNNNYEEHSFYCVCCGNKGIPIQRKSGFQHSKMHRKKLYCIHCQQEVNHIECKNYAEVEEFKINFEKGVYIDEAKASLAYVRNSILDKTSQMI